MRDFQLNTRCLHKRGFSIPGRTESPLQGTKRGQPQVSPDRNSRGSNSVHDSQISLSGFIGIASSGGSLWRRRRRQRRWQQRGFVFSEQLFVQFKFWLRQLVQFFKLVWRCRQQQFFKLFFKLLKFFQLIKLFVRRLKQLRCAGTARAQHRHHGKRGIGQ